MTSSTVLLGDSCLQVGSRTPWLESYLQQDLTETQEAVTEPNESLKPA